MDANELFRSPKVRQFIIEMAELEKRSKASQQSSDSIKSTD